MRRFSILVLSFLLGSPKVADAALNPESWLNLNEGGIAVGHPQGKKAPGKLVNASLLPEEGPGFRRIGGEKVNWGAGHMVSLLTNAARAFSDRFPDVTLMIDGISRKDGGRFAPHKSHQNGLDADLLFVGRKNWESMLEGQRVSSRFDVEKNWELWKMLASQKIQIKGEEESIVSMILVAPEIQKHVCEWAQRKGLTQDPDAQELLRRIQPAPGHDAHFHLRIRCSPAHKNCVDAFYLPPGPACRSISWQGARKSPS